MDEKSKVLYFYPSKIKSIFMIVFGFIFLAASVVICYSAFIREDYFMSLLGGISVVFLIFFILIFFIRTIKSVPYLTLTDKELITNSGTKKSISIKWEDIAGYQIENIHVKFNKLTFIEIILYDEEKYKAQLSSLQRKLNVIGTMGGDYSRVSIRLAPIKITERDLLFYALDNITSPNFDIENVPKSNEEKRIDSFMKQINRYFLKSYLFSFIMTAPILLAFYTGLDEVNILNYAIISFVLFPFARFIIDIFYLFNLKSMVENKSNSIKNVYQLCSAIIYLFLYVVSPVIGAIGLVYFIMVVIRRWIKKREDG